MLTTERKTNILAKLAAAPSRRPAVLPGNISYYEATRPVLRAGNSRFNKPPTWLQKFRASMKNSAPPAQRAREIAELSAARAKRSRAPLPKKGSWWGSLKSRVMSDHKRNAAQARLTVRGIRGTGGVPEPGKVRSVRSLALAKAYLAVTGSKLYPRDKQIPRIPNVPAPAKVKVKVKVPKKLQPPRRVVGN